MPEKIKLFANESLKLRQTGFWLIKIQVISLT